MWVVFLLYLCKREIVCLLVVNIPLHNNIFYEKRTITDLLFVGNKCVYLCGKTRSRECGAHKCLYFVDIADEYTLYLNLSDPEETLHDNPDFSIRLANEDMWEASMGYNKLGVITVE